MQLYTCDPAVEVIGQNVLGFIENSQKSEIMPLLEKHGLDQIVPEQWYPLQKWLDVLKDMEDDNSLVNFVAVGMGISQTAPLPPEVLQLPFETFFTEALPGAYQMQHRGGDAGRIKIEKVGDNRLRIEVAVPYPDDLEYGVTYGFARRIIPAGQGFTLRYDEELQRGKGADRTIMYLEWQ